MNNFLYSLAFYENQRRDESFAERIRYVSEALNQGRVNFNNAQISGTRKIPDFLSE